MKLSEMVKLVWTRLGPEVKVYENEKKVELSENYIGSNVIEAYYILKGYEVERVSVIF